MESEIKTFLELEELNKSYNLLESLYLNGLDDIYNSLYEPLKGGAIIDEAEKTLDKLKEFISIALDSSSIKAKQLQQQIKLKQA